MKKVMVTLFALVISVFAFAACTQGGNVQDESSGGVGSTVSAVDDIINSDVSEIDSDITTSSEAASDVSSM